MLNEIQLYDFISVSSQWKFQLLYLFDTRNSSVRHIIRLFSWGTSAEVWDGHHAYARIYAQLLSEFVVMGQIYSLVE